MGCRGLRTGARARRWLAWDRFTYPQGCPGESVNFLCGAERKCEKIFFYLGWLSLRSKKKISYSAQCCLFPGIHLGNPTIDLVGAVGWDRKKWDIPLFTIYLVLNNDLVALPVGSFTWQMLDLLGRCRVSWRVWADSEILWRF